MSNDIKVSVKADADLGGLNSALVEAAKNAELLSKSMAGGAINIDTDKFNQQINQTTAALNVLHGKIQEKKQLGIDTKDAESQLTEFTQKKADASKLLITGGSSAGGKTALEETQERERSSIEKTRQAYKNYFREISQAEGSAVNRSFDNFKSGKNPLSAYVNHASFADLVGDNSGKPQEQVSRRQAAHRIIKNAGLHESGIKQWIDQPRAEGVAEKKAAEPKGEHAKPEAEPRRELPSLVEEHIKPRAEGVAEKKAAVARREQEQVKEIIKWGELKDRKFTEFDAKAIIRAKERLDTGNSALAEHSRPHKNVVDLLDDNTEGGKSAAQRTMQNAGLHEAGVKAKGGAGASASKYGGPLAGAAIGMAGGMVAGGAGGDGMAAAGSALGGMVGSVFGPVGSMIGGALGGMAGGVVGGGMGDAKEEAIGVTDLRHSLGSTSVEFDSLRESVRAAASGMGMTSIEATRLAKQFSHNANTSAKDASNLASEVRLASGLSRSLGLDPSNGVEAMSALRNTHVTTDEAGSRRMAMTIAEAISKGGMSSKGDEVLSAIASFAQANARASLQTPNVTGYADYMSRMVGTKTPGLDVQGSASLLGKADAGIRSHGDLASEVFKLGAFTKKFGSNFNSMDMDLYTSQGAFGTARGVAQDILDDKTALPERRKSAQDVISSGNADRPIQDIMMDQLGTIAPRGSALYEQAGAHLFGMEHNEFRKYQQTYNTEGGSAGMRSQLDAMGVNTAKLDPSKFMHMGALLGSNKDELKAEGEKLISGNGYSKGMDDKQKEHLRSLINSGSEGDLKKEVIKLQEGRELTDIGTATRNNTADIKQGIIDLSSKLLPAVKSVQDAILLAGGKDPQKLAETQKKWALSSASEKIHNESEAKLKALSGVDKDGKPITKDTDDYIKRRQAIIAEEKAAQKTLSDEYDSSLVKKEIKAQDEEGVRSIPVSSEGGRVSTGRIYRPGTPVDVKQDVPMPGQALSSAMSGNLASQVKSAKNVKITPDQLQTIQDVSGGDAEKAKLLENLLRTENRGQGQVTNGAVSPSGAKGAFQIMDGTANDRIKEGALGNETYDPKNFKHSAKIAAAQYDWLKKNKVKDGNPVEMSAWYNGGYPGGEKSPENRRQNNDYMGIVSGLYDDKVPEPAKPKTQDASQSPAGGDHTITIVVKSADNKFHPEKVKVTIPASAKSTGGMNGVAA